MSPCCKLRAKSKGPKDGVLSNVHWCIVISINLPPFGGTFLIVAIESSSLFKVLDAIFGLLLYKYWPHALFMAFWTRFGRECFRNRDEVNVVNLELVNYFPESFHNLTGAWHLSTEIQTSWITPAAIPNEKQELLVFQELLGLAHFGAFRKSNETLLYELIDEFVFLRSIVEIIPGESLHSIHAAHLVKDSLHFWSAFGVLLWFPIISTRKNDLYSKKMIDGYLEAVLTDKRELLKEFTAIEYSHKYGILV